MTITTRFGLSSGHHQLLQILLQEFIQYANLRSRGRCDGLITRPEKSYRVLVRRCV